MSDHDPDKCVNNERVKGLRALFNQVITDLEESISELKVGQKSILRCIKGDGGSEDGLSTRMRMLEDLMLRFVSADKRRKTEAFRVRLLLIGMFLTLVGRWGFDVFFNGGG